MKNIYKIKKSKFIIAGLCIAVSACSPGAWEEVTGMQANSSPPLAEELTTEGDNGVVPASSSSVAAVTPIGV